MKKGLYIFIAISVCTSFILLQQMSSSNASDHKDDNIDTSNGTKSEKKTKTYLEESDYFTVINLDFVYFNDNDDLINLADIIVTGKAEMISSELDNGIPTGKYHIQIEHVYKGERVESIMMDKVIKTYGTMKVANDLPMLLNDTTYLFTLVNTATGYQMHNALQGCYELDSDEAKDILNYYGESI